MSVLIIDFAGEVRTVEDRLSFGRTADLEIDVNQYMHRTVGEFVRRDGVWRLHNVGSHIHLTVVSNDGKRVELPPKAVQILAASEGVVRFSAGPTRYEIEYRLPDVEVDTDLDPDVSGESTTEFALVFTPREIDFLVAFARPLLMRTDGAMPTYAEVARLWGVSPKTLDNTVQGIKRKLRGAGIARDEPLEMLVSLVVRHGLVTREDLDWARLHSDDPRPAAEGPRFTPPPS
jgi:hypothetical protein